MSNTPEWYASYLRAYANGLSATHCTARIHEAADVLEQTIYELENKIAQSEVCPCKPGDTVYVLYTTKDGSGFINEMPVCGYHYIDPPKQRSTKRGSYLIVYHETSGTISHIPYSQLGITLFLSYEDAKNALDKRQAEYVR